MPTSPTPKMRVSSIDDTEIARDEIEYYVRRLQNRVFDEIISAVSQEIKGGRIDRKALIKRIGASPAQMSRWLAGPSNYRLDTIARLLIGMGAELDPSVSFIRDRTIPNFAHELVDLIDSATGALPVPDIPPEDVDSRPGTRQRNTATPYPLESAA